MKQHETRFGVPGDDRPHAGQSHPVTQHFECRDYGDEDPGADREVLYDVLARTFDGAEHIFNYGGPLPGVYAMVLLAQVPAFGYQRPRLVPAGYWRNGETETL